MHQQRWLIIHSGELPWHDALVSRNDVQFGQRGVGSRWIKAANGHKSQELRLEGVRKSYSVQFGVGFERAFRNRLAPVLAVSAGVHGVLLNPAVAIVVLARQAGEAG